MRVVGLVGCGAWGTNILRDLLSLGCTVYVADLDSRARSRASGMGAADVFPDLDGLPGCDGYVVAVPIPALAGVCATLLRGKKPIFSEKTLLMSMDDYDRLRRLDGSAYLFVMHKWHYHPGIEALRLVAASGKIGAVEELFTTRYAWVNDFHGGDVFWTQAVHDLTIVRHILGYIPDRIRAINVVLDERHLPVSFTAMLGDNPAVVISVCGRHCRRLSGVSMHGQRGSAELQNAYDEQITIRNDEGEEKVPIDTTFPLYLELKEFVAYLSGGPKPRCGLEDAREITAAILHLRRTAGL